jgi:hypothetical protein
MQSLVLLDMPGHQKKPPLVREADAESFPVPIRFGTVRRESAFFQGLYPILLREHHRQRAKRSWAFYRSIIGV